MSNGLGVRVGKPFPLGATPDEGGVNFAVFSEWAHRIDLCLFDPKNPAKETARIPLPEITKQVHHGYVPGVKPGALYGFRAHGPFAPEKGLRFNHHKLLVDPYARAMIGVADAAGPKDDLKLDVHDSAAHAPKGIVHDPAFDWEGVEKPNVPWTRTIVYEAHVKGFTKLKPDVPAELRGTYGGFAHPASIAHLKALGVTAVELLPIHQALDEGFLKDKKLSNYWGYATLGFFAPDTRFACAGPFNVVNEFKGLVKALHKAGIEVILDVVYNHTCEGNQMGPSLSLKGLDNLAYYRVSPENPRFYQDFTGTGNSLNVRHPQTQKLIVDSLRYWATEMQVDGFRFDLAVTLGRDRVEFDRWGALFQTIHADPVLSQVKLIAEPWDVGPNGYQVANFSVDFAEWNGKYRDSIRRYWKGDDNLAAELGYRLTGSSDLFQLSGRSPAASVNFVTCHDGFTLHDLVTYNGKHNEANGESNRDGTDDNQAWNCGVEGETKDAAVVALREKQKRNFLATLFLSQGTPMLTAGDEMGRTQRGNNNAYCQDNEISWVDWKLDDRRRALLEFTKNVIALRQTQHVLHRTKFFRGKQIWESELKDLAWFRPDGKEMKQDDWQKPTVKTLAFLLGGDAAQPNEEGERMVHDSLLVVMNAHPEPVPFTLPELKWGSDWEIVVDTGDGDLAKRPKSAAGAAVKIAGRSLMVLKRNPL